jgi:peptide deformylase
MKLDNQILDKTCDQANFDNPKKNLRLAHSLIRLMHQEKGIGLAANQAGINVRLFVMFIDNHYRHCFNPEILEFGSEKIELKEGCLSFPGQYCNLIRPEKIKVKYQTAYGAVIEEWLEGWASRCFQHELDHLNGTTMLDRQNELAAVVQW